MKETGGAAAAAVELSIGQKLIKVISNVCFTAFVFSVLVFTVIAITYQPPDPWLQSTAALTKNLAATLPNATFATDESLLPTGEDLVSLPHNASNLSPTAISVIVVQWNSDEREEPGEENTPCACFMVSRLTGPLPV